MPYNFTNKNDIDLFVNDNIVELNKKMKAFTYKNYVKHFKGEGLTEEQAKERAHDIPTSTDIELYLHKKFQSKIAINAEREEIDSELDNITERRQTYFDNVFKDIAVRFELYYQDLETYHTNRIYSKIKDLWSAEGSQYKSAVLASVSSYNEYNTGLLTDSEIAFIKKDFETTFCEYYELTLDGGFQRKKTDVSTGTRRANEGDAAQFLFLARAILSGFNCSNVDVRASSYDAVIDYNTYLLRVQVKGINHDAISFKTSTRGGAGADTGAPTNEAKPITSEDCDIYVAVEKSSGICYIIPIEKIEEYAENDIFSLPNRDKILYKERWDYIEEKAKSRFNL